ncbi:MAG: ABC transporter substrate-binding protein [Alphaproteobacteria bacterium]
MGWAWRMTAAAVLGTAVLIAAAPRAPVRAETPADMLVMGTRIDDIITLDPAEVFEFSAAEISNNVYDRIMTYEPDDFSELTGGVVESWEISEDGKTIDFTMRDGLRFHSGNPVRAEDAVFSLRRVVKLNKTPAFILTQLGWTPENVDELIRVTGDDSFALTITEDLSPGLVLNALSATVGSVVDRELVLANEVDGDLGYQWLKSNSAGSGPFELQSWNANEAVVLDAFADYRAGAPAMRRVILRHVAEPAAQRLLLEEGDIDIARTLTPDQLAGLEGDEGIAVEANPKSTLLYVAANDGHDVLGQPQVQEALRYLIDYEGMAARLLKGQVDVHQSFWPSGLWAAVDDRPYGLDVARAEALLEEAGVGEGFAVTLDTLNSAPYMEIAQSIQETMGQAGIEVEIVPQDGSALWPKYRARRHELILARWGPDYLDPHSNADSFAHNPDNSEEAQLTGKLAWRNAWSDPAVDELTEEASRTVDRERRAELYAELQRLHQRVSPFAIMFQQNEVIARRDDVEGFVSGPVFDLVFYRGVTKN